MAEAPGTMIPFVERMPRPRCGVSTSLPVPPAPGWLFSSSLC
jgi:hypothetical protein